MSKTIQPAIIYVRVSGARQVREGNGLKSQEQRCRQYAKMKGYSVVAVFREKAKSGGAMVRPEMTELLTFLGQQRTEIVVIVDDPKRWARDVVVHFSLKDEIMKRRGRLESPSFVFQDNAIGKFTETVYAAGAELERNQNREQVENRMRARLEMGFWPFHAPAGYVWMRHPTYKRILTPDEPKATIIRQAIEDFAAGTLPAKLDVARFLIERGYFKEPPRLPCTSLQHADRILTNVLYTGHVGFRKWNIPLRKGHHASIISMSTFLAVKDRLADCDKSFKRKDQRPDFALRNFVACDTCGSNLTASCSKGTNKRYPYYHCYNKECDECGLTISNDTLHERFALFLDTLCCPSDVIDLLRLELLAAWNELGAEVERKRSEHPRRIKDIARQVNDLTDKMLDLTSKLAIKALEDKIESLEEKRVQLEAETYEVPYAEVDVEGAIDFGLNLLRNPRAAWEDGSFTTKRTLQASILAAPIRHDRKSGFRTPDLRLLYRISTTHLSSQNSLVDEAEMSSNELLDEVVRLGLQLSRQDYPEMA